MAIRNPSFAISATIGLLIVVCAVRHSRAEIEELPPKIAVQFVDPLKDESKAKLPFGRPMQLLITNLTDKPIRLWHRRCLSGWRAPSLIATDEAGRQWEIRRHDDLFGDDYWPDHPPKSIRLEPGAAHTVYLGLTGIQGSRRLWDGVPEPNTGETFRFQAVYEIAADDDAREHGVWTGRVVSPPIAVQFKDPKLETPLDYLDDFAPNQALKMIRDDPSWAKKRIDDRSLLYAAVRREYKEVVRALLELGADANDGSLAETRDVETALWLLQHGADPNFVNPRNGETLLEAMATNWKPNPEVVRLIRAFGGKHNLRSAALLGDAETVKRLWPKRNHFWKKSFWGPRDLLAAAARSGHKEVVAAMLDLGVDVDGDSISDHPAAASAIHHPDILALLLTADSDFDFRRKYSYRDRWGTHETTLLRGAAGRGVIESAELLIARGTDVDVKDDCEQTPLMAAAGRNRVAMVYYLIAQGADTGVQDYRGLTAMRIAAEEIRPNHRTDNARYEAIIRVLAACGEEIDFLTAIAINDVDRAAELLKDDPRLATSRDHRGYSALHRAVELDCREIVRLLLDHGCPVDIRNQDDSRGGSSCTALSSAAFWDRPEIAKMLLEHGAEVNAKTGSRFTPLHSSARMSSLEVTKILLAAGADVNAEDNRGKTPLAWAGADTQRLLKRHGAK